MATRCSCSHAMSCQFKMDWDHAPGSCALSTCSRQFTTLLAQAIDHKPLVRATRSHAVDRRWKYCSLDSNGQGGTLRKVPMRWRCRPSSRLAYVRWYGHLAHFQEATLLTQVLTIRVLCFNGALSSPGRTPAKHFPHIVCNGWAQSSAIAPLLHRVWPRHFMWLVICHPLSLSSVASRSLSA